MAEHDRVDLASARPGPAAYSSGAVERYIHPLRVLQ